MQQSTSTKSRPELARKLWPHSTALPPTEQRNPRSMTLDQLPVVQAVQLMLREEAKVPRVLVQWQKEITTAVKLVADAFRKNGRLFYVGAGTSGRLGVLDASECPPTFRAAPEMVQGIIAGGEVALHSSVEGAEDDAGAGAREIRQRRISSRDVVVGIAASGTTPFVWGALAEAKARRAKTILLCFNPHLIIPHQLRPHLVLAPDLGPEVLTGSTRLKAGTATKLVLNMLTTLAMVQIGKVAGNLMVDLTPANAKLRERSVRILRELSGVDARTARQALGQSGWVIKKAAARLSRK